MLDTLIPAGPRAPFSATTRNQFPTKHEEPVFHYVRQRRAGQQLNPVSYVVVPVIGAVSCAYLLSRLDSNAITLGVSWLVLGVLVLALITRGFKAAPPEMTATEKATVEAAA